MTLTEKARTELLRTLGVVRVAAGIALLAAISQEIIRGDHTHFSQAYLDIQLVVCLIFMGDFFTRWAIDEHRSSFPARNVVYFLLSIPYLNIFAWSHAQLPHDWAMLIGLIPMARAFLAFYIVVKWLVSNRISMLLTAYIVTVVVFTYLSALIFYYYEAPVNDTLHGFGNALWWAWMNVTTVGAQIFAVTPVGKVITILLPTLGMMMFPIFTSYILQQYTGKKKSEDA